MTTPIDPAALKQAAKDAEAAHAKAAKDAAGFRNAWKAAALAFGLELPRIQPTPTPRLRPGAKPPEPTPAPPVPTLDEMTKLLATTAAANAAELAARKAHVAAQAALQAWVSS